MLWSSRQDRLWDVDWLWDDNLLIGTWECSWMLMVAVWCVVRGALALLASMLHYVGQLPPAIRLTMAVDGA
jgi:hypothetical protein